MDLYEQAYNWHNSADTLKVNKFYQQSIYHYCLSGELYLKSVLDFVSHNADLEISHDTIGIYGAIASKYGKDTQVTEAVKYMRKYFNEARYPSTSLVFTEQLADDFSEYANRIKNYIDEKCHVSADELINHIKKRE